MVYVDPVTNALQKFILLLFAEIDPTSCNLQVGPVVSRYFQDAHKKTFYINFFPKMDKCCFRKLEKLET